MKAWSTWLTIDSCIETWQQEIACKLLGNLINYQQRMIVVVWWPRVSETLQVRVSDFGLARDVYSSDYYRASKNVRLPVKWMPPETLNDGISNEKTDVVSKTSRWYQSLSPASITPPSYHMPTYPTHPPPLTHLLPAYPTPPSFLSISPFYITHPSPLLIMHRLTPPSHIQWTSRDRDSLKNGPLSPSQRLSLSCYQYEMFYVPPAFHLRGFPFLAINTKCSMCPQLSKILKFLLQVKLW
jgi:hypothetical protein